jgi:PleD family two-component response regulator
MADVIRASDQALYSAKREGRDRVSVWTAEAVV